MVRRDIVSVIYELTGIERETAAAVLDALPEVVMRGLRNGERVAFKNLGTFCLKENKERGGRNPQTGEVVTFPASKTVKFKINPSLKNFLKAED